MRRKSGEERSDRTNALIEQTQPFSTVRTFSYTYRPPAHRTPCNQLSSLFRLLHLTSPQSNILSRRLPKRPSINPKKPIKTPDPKTGFSPQRVDTLSRPALSALPPPTSKRRPPQKNTSGTVDQGSQIPRVTEKEKRDRHNNEKKNKTPCHNTYPKALNYRHLHFSR